MGLRCRVCGCNEFEETTVEHIISKSDAAAQPKPLKDLLVAADQAINALDELADAYFQYGNCHYTNSIISYIDVIKGQQIALKKLEELKSNGES